MIRAIGCKVEDLATPVNALERGFRCSRRHRAHKDTIDSRQRRPRIYDFVCSGTGCGFQSMLVGIDRVNLLSPQGPGKPDVHQSRKARAQNKNATLGDRVHLSNASHDTTKELGKRGVLEADVVRYSEETSPNPRFKNPNVLRKAT